MNRRDIAELMVHAGYPAISIFVCGKNIGEYHEQLNALLTQALREIAPKCDKKAYATIEQYCNNMQARIPRQDTYKSIACFISASGAQLYTLPFTLTTQLQVNT